MDGYSRVLASLAGLRREHQSGDQLTAFTSSYLTQLLLKLCTDFFKTELNTSTLVFCSIYVPRQRLSKFFAASDLLSKNAQQEIFYLYFINLVSVILRMVETT